MSGIDRVDAIEQMVGWERERLDRILEEQGVLADVSFVDCGTRCFVWG